jgi:hypothetical protein
MAASGLADKCFHHLLTWSCPEGHGLGRVFTGGGLDQEKHYRHSDVQIGMHDGRLSDNFQE